MKRTMMASISILLLFLCLFPTGFSKTLYVGENQSFQSIQSAITAADPYDTIRVSCGTYVESIQILKPLSIIGEKGCTQIISDDQKDIITIAADNCTLSGFIIKDKENASYSGVYVLSNGNLISENEFVNNKGWGLYLYHCQNNDIVNNTFMDDGICVVGTKDEWLSMTVEKNTVLDHPIIWVENKTNMTIRSERIGQLILVNCTNCIIDNVSVNRTDQGVVLAYSDRCTLRDSSIETCRFGIRMQYAHNNSIDGNMISHNEYGVYVTHSDGNDFVGNTIIENLVYGAFFCCNSNLNILTMNSFINNSEVAYDYFENEWSKNGIGNYYSDYYGLDKNGDGIGEAVYEIPPDFGDNIDAYPIVDFDKISNLHSEESSGFITVLPFIALVFLLLFCKMNRKK